MEVRFYLSLIQLLECRGSVFCLVMKMKMVLKFLQRGRFYAPTQVVLLFVKDA